MGSKGKVFKGNPRTAALMLPLISSAHLNKSGICMGIDLKTHEPFCLDPWKARVSDSTRRRQIRPLTGTATRLKGQRDTGKSAFNKALALRASGTQVGIIPRELRGLDARGPATEGVPDQITEEWLDTFRVHIFDQKPEEGSGEYEPLRQLLRGTSLRPAEGSGINPLDPTMNDQLSMLEIAINLAETSLGRNVHNYEPLAMQVAVSTMYSLYRDNSGPELLQNILLRQGGEELTLYYKLENQKLLKLLRDRTDAESEPSGALAHLREILEQSTVKHNVPLRDFQNDSALMAVQMGRICGGDFGKLSGDGQSIRELFGKQLLVIDRTGMSPKARVVFDALSIRWQTWVLDNNLRSLMPHLRLGDEEADSYDSLMYLRFYDEFIRKNRAFHTWDCRAIQYGNRLDNIGEAGSETRMLANSIRQGLSQVINGSIPPDEKLLHELTLDGMSDADAATHVGLPPGCFSYKAPNRPIVFFQLILTEREMQIVPSNAATEAVLDRRNVWTLDEVRERADRKFAEQQTTTTEEVS